jgi:hypothetical protein
MTIQEKIEKNIRRSAGNVFLRKDFDRFGGYDQVGRALRGVISKGMLVRAGYGIYVKARESSTSGNPIPIVPLMSIGLEALKKLGVEADVGRSARELRDGVSTQIPVATVIDVRKSRIKRKIGFGKRMIRYERQ